VEACAACILDVRRIAGSDLEDEGPGWWFLIVNKPIDALFLLLAVASAYGVAAGTGSD